MRPLLLALGLVACGGPIEETLVDELRVVAAIPDAPELAPGESFGVDVTAVDPAGQGFETLVWACTPSGPPGDPCLEQASERTEGWVARADEDGRAADLLITPALAGLLGTDEVEEVAVPLWVLSCELELCPLIGEATGLSAGDPGWDEVASRLADPAGMLAELPMQGVALTRRSVVVSTRAAEDRNAHPVIVSAPDGPIEAPVEDEGRFTLTVEDDQPTSAFGYTTLGGFDAIEVEAEAGALELGWFPGEQAESGQSAELFVIVSDGRGGEALWRGSGVVVQGPAVD